MKDNIEFFYCRQSYNKSVKFSSLLARGITSQGNGMINYTILGNLPNISKRKGDKQMIRIVKHGNDMIRFTCRECRCIFECDREDYTETVERDDEYGVVALHYYATCPECDKTNVVTKAPST